MHALPRQTAFLCTLLLIASPLHAQWSHTNGPEGSGVYLIVGQGGALFASTDNGIYRSTNTGGSWQVMDALSNLGGLILLAPSMSRLYANFTSGLYASEDQGTTWRGLPSGAGTRTLISGDTLFRFSPGLVIRSRDLGETWDSTRIDSSMHVYYLVTGNGTIFGNSRNRDSSLAVSSDGGSSWLVRHNALPSGWGSLATHDTLLFFANSKALFRSVNSGGQWTPCTPPLGADSILGQVWVGEKYILAFAGIHLYRSTDLGSSWARLDSSPTGLRPGGLSTFAQSSSTLFAGNGSGIWASQDSGKTWARSGSGLPLVSCSAVFAPMPANVPPVLFATASSADVFRSTDLGTTWEAAGEGLEPYAVARMIFHAGWLFATAGRKVYRSSDLGSTWAPADSGLRHLSPYSHIASNGAALFYGSWDSSGCWRSTDDGVSWARADTADRLLMYMSGLTAMGQNLIAGAGNDGFAYSTDQGANWRAADWTKPPSPDIYWPVSFAQNGSRMFASVVQGGRRDSTFIFCSADSGRSWRPAGPQMAPGFMLTLLAEGGTLLGCTPTILRSINNGATWDWFSQGFESGQVSLGTLSTLASAGGYLFTATNKGVWQRPIADLLMDVKPVAPLPTGGSFQLDQNYPNPFNPTTTIRYSLPRRSHVTLTLFNTLGQKVAELVKGDIDAGVHEVLFNAGTLASGVYVYRLQAGTYSGSRRFIVLK